MRQWTGADIAARFPATGGKDHPERVRGTIARLKRVMPVMNGFWPAEWSPEVLINASQTGNRMGIDPSKAREEVKQMTANIPAIRMQVDSARIDAGAKVRVLKHLEGIGE